MILFLTALLLSVSLTFSEMDNLPSDGLILAQATPASSSAVSSQAVATQPDNPVRADQTIPPTPESQSQATNATPPLATAAIDPLLDPDRPKDCQLALAAEQTIPCGAIPVVLPAGTYKQIEIMEAMGARRATDHTSLKPQEIGLGYIRYLADTPIKVNEVERDGGIDIPVRKSDNLPVRIWYRKMKEPDDITKAFSFILPPIALIAGAGAWSSGNILLPDSTPVFTEYRDYYLKPTKPKTNASDIPKPSSARPLGGLSAPGSSNLRSK
jgi:hypothetical protein